MEKFPAFIISLDFELHWGMSDIVLSDDHSYMANLRGAREAIPKILEVFRKYGIHATWATVGFLFSKSKEEIYQNKPSRIPNYDNTRLNNWCLNIGKNEEDDPLHYACSLVDLIGSTLGQELASHTFSHYYCYEPGQTPEDFLADLMAARNFAKAAG